MEVEAEAEMEAAKQMSVNVVKSLRAFAESVFANLRVKNVVFTIQGKKAIYSCQYTGAVIG